MCVLADNLSYGKCLKVRARVESQRQIFVNTRSYAILRILVLGVRYIFTCTYEIWDLGVTS